MQGLRCLVVSPLSGEYLHRAAHQSVSTKLSKIPDGGFSPIRFQTITFRSAPSRPPIGLSGDPYTPLNSRFAQTLDAHVLFRWSCWLGVQYHLSREYPLSSRAPLLGEHYLSFLAPMGSCADPSPARPFRCFRLIGRVFAAEVIHGGCEESS